MRRTALLPTALVLLAGCAGVVTDASTATPASRPPGDGSTTTATATTDSPTATPRPRAAPPGPKSSPERPERRTVETAGDYAHRYELRHSYDELWEPGAEVGPSVDSCGVESAAPYRDGYRVVVRCVGYVNRPVAGETRTRTRHADLRPWTVRYYVDRNGLRRDEVEG